MQTPFNCPHANQISMERMWFWNGRLIGSGERWISSWQTYSLIDSNGLPWDSRIGKSLKLLMCAYLMQVAMVLYWWAGIWNGNLKIVELVFSQDGFIDDGVLEIDERQDFQLLKMDNTSVNFTRKFDTDDMTDVRFHESTMSLLYFREVSSPKFPYQLIYNFSQTNERYGSVSVQLLSAAHYKVDDRWASRDFIIYSDIYATCPNSSSTDVKILDIKLEDQLVPLTTNTYYCKYLKVPEGAIDQQKNQIIQFEAVRSPTSLSNFMLLFSCNSIVGDDALAKSEVCNEFMETQGLCEKVNSSRIIFRKSDITH